MAFIITTNPDFPEETKMTIFGVGEINEVYASFSGNFDETSQFTINLFYYKDVNMFQNGRQRLNLISNINQELYFDLYGQEVSKEIIYTLIYDYLVSLNFLVQIVP